MYGRRRRRLHKGSARYAKRKFRRIYSRYRRRYRRRGLYGNKSYGIFRANVGKTHTYSCMYPVTLSDGGFYDFQIPIRINSLYDPWVGITGAMNTVASGYDLMHSIWSRYAVTGAKCIVTLRQRTVPRPNTTIGGFTGGTGSVGPAITPWENPCIKWGVNIGEVYPFAPGGANLWLQAATVPNTKMGTFQASSNGNARSTLVIKWSARKWFGVKDVLGRSDIGAEIGYSPVRVVYLNTFAQYGDYSYIPSEQLGFDVDIKVIFKARWSGLRQVGTTLPGGARVVPTTS